MCQCLHVSKTNVFYLVYNLFLDRQRIISIHRYIGCLHEIDIQIFKKSDWAKEIGYTFNGFWFVLFRQRLVTVFFNVPFLHWFPFKMRFSECLRHVLIKVLISN